MRFPLDLEVTLMALSGFMNIVLSLVFLFFLGSLSLALYIHVQHLRYGHIPGPARDGFFTGNIPSIRQERKRIPGRGMSEIWLNWYRRYGSIFVMWIYFVPVVILADPEMAKKALITLNLPKASRVYSKISYVFGQRAVGRGVLTELDHDVWRRKRAMLNPAFHRKYLMNLMDSFNSVCDRFLKNLTRHADGKTPVKMADQFGRVTLDIIGKVGFNINLDNTGDPDTTFPSAIYKALEGMDAFFHLTPFWPFQISMFPFQTSVIEAVKYIRSFAKQVIEERLLAMQNGEESPMDILDHILREARENPEVSMEDLVDNFVTFFIAGQETTSNQLSFTLFEILKHPHVEKRILQEIEEVLGCRETLDYEDLGKLQYLGQTLKESLRLHPPIGGTQRVVQSEDTFGSYKIPGKTTVVVSSFTIHNSPEVWENPTKFDPDRFCPSRTRAISQLEYFPFSIGPRNCIGRTLAQFEAKVLMARVLQEFKFEILPGQTSQPDERVTIRPRDGVICTLTPR